VLDAPQILSPSTHAIFMSMIFHLITALRP
jgi:hypothetical protein